MEGDNGNGKSEDGDDELRHADPEGCLVHDATASLAVANAIQKSEMSKSPAGEKARCLWHRVEVDTSCMKARVVKGIVFAVAFLLAAQFCETVATMAGWAIDF